MLFTSSIPFREAIKRQAVKSILPTILSSSELSGISADILMTAAHQPWNDADWFDAWLKFARGQTHNVPLASQTKRATVGDRAHAN